MTRLVSVFGDSISTFIGTQPEGYRVFYQNERLEESGVLTVADTWWAQVIEAMDGELCANAAWSGSMVEGDGFPVGQSFERIAALARPSDGVKPDDIIIYYGINDYGWGSVEAETIGKPDNAPSGPDAPPVVLPNGGLAPADALEQFAAAYLQMLTRIRAAYPDARVWCISLIPGRVRGAARSTFTYNFRGAPFAGYNAAIEQAANATGAVFCDAASLGYDYEALEGTHPTVQGMKQIAWLAACSLQQNGAFTGKDLGPFPGGDAFASSNPCIEPGRVCVDCPYALSTTNRWAHVCLNA